MAVDTQQLDNLDVAERLLGMVTSKQSRRHPTARSDVMFVTPEMAREWLTRNVNNRKITKPLVGRLAASIRDELFGLDVSAIAFYTDWTLANGQHRLEAVVEAGEGQFFLVMWGVPLSSRDIIDGGKRRTLTDLMVMDGLANDKQAASVLRYIMYMLRVWDGSMATFSDGSGQPTVRELLAFAHTLIDRETGRDDLLPSLTVGRHMQVSAGAPLSVSIAGACHFHMARAADLETANHFFRILDKGFDGDYSITSEYDPLYRLRRGLLVNAESPRHLGAMALAAVTIKAWNYWRAGDKIRLLRWGADDEPFPKIGAPPHESLKRRRKAAAKQQATSDDVDAAPVASLVGVGGDDR